MFESMPALLGAGSADVLPTTVGPGWLWLVPILALAGCVACGLCLAMRVRTKAPAWIVVGLLGIAFVLTFMGYSGWDSASAQVVKVFEWIGLSWGDSAGQSLSFNFGFYMDGLSWLWMLFVTGLGTLIALYASEYMQGDKGYARFFAGFALFVFSMACLVMADNLVLLYLGWEGVGLCSYLLIGYFYKKPSAVAAAKKAFIVNRIGDLGLALGLFLTFVTFGTVQYDELFALIDQGVAGDMARTPLSEMWQTWAIPLLLMVGAFGKSAQLPLYVWLPDAMEGPTPVSALIHAATMVTAGVYLVARFFPLFAFEGVPHYALWTVGWVGALTALFSSTIAMAQFDIKRIMAYSTISQLGYMFAGLGVLSTVGAASHVFTHAFFKALLFLACGAVMHGFAGQLDLRKLSGLWSVPGWRIVCVTMLIGCMNLAGVPLITAGYWSKDMIMAEAFVTPGGQIIGWILLLTAGLTAYYTFRVFFRVFVGPVSFEPGDEHHDDEHGHDNGHGGGGGFHPHAPGWAVNTVLAVLALSSFAAIGLYFTDKPNGGFVGNLVGDSTAGYVTPYGHHGADDGHDDAHAAAEGDVRFVLVADPPAHASGDATGGDHGADGTPDAAHASSGGLILGMDPHKAMYYISAVVGLIGILIAAVLHGPLGMGGLGLGTRTEAARSKADELLPALGPVARWAQHKWYVDEFYDFLLRTPLRVLSHVFHAIDKLLVDGLVNGLGLLPRAMGSALRPSQSGVLQGYAAGMAGGLVLLLVIVLIFM